MEVELYGNGKISIASEWLIFCIWKSLVINTLLIFWFVVVFSCEIVGELSLVFKQEFNFDCDKEEYFIHQQC